MENKLVAVELNESAHQYEIKIGHDLLDQSGIWAKKCLSANTKKIVIVSNAKIFRLYGAIVQNSLEKSGFDVSIWLMKDGEKHKNLRSAETLLKFLSTNQITRTDAVVGLGGGVVGDLAGFAAAVFQRGIAFLQIPTTFLAMIDSSVGGKTAVNTEFGKNLIGSFHQPNGVLIDVSVLQTLEKREITAGFCEAVKQGAIADQRLFDQTAEFLKSYPVKNFKKFHSQPDFIKDLCSLIAAQVSFKAQIVQGDEKENSARSDGKSRKILNFGHTLAHALEKVTEYKYFKHGEAVGYGIIFAAELSKRLDIFDNNELNLLCDVVHRAGELPSTKSINLEQVFAAFKHDKKTVGQSLQWILLESIGKPKIVTDRDISNSTVQQTLEKVLHS